MLTHPRIARFNDLAPLTGSARERGYRMPAEWEPLAAVWVDPPHNPETWPGCLDQAQAQFRAFLDVLTRHVTVKNVRDLGAPTNDSWIRDYGPIFVKKTPTPSPSGPDASSPVTPHAQSGAEAHGVGDVSPSEIALHDFRFNCWGGKYGPRELDDVVPQHIARHLGVPLFIHDMVLEGGSVDVNGQGTVMTTGQCLLNKNRNPQLKKKQIEHVLHTALGTRHVIWLPGGIIGDDTDGHIDDIARFVAPTTLLGLRAPEGHPDYEILNRNWTVLKRAHTHDGQKFNVVELPVPQPIYYDFPPDRFSSGGHRPVAASYANFLIANGGVFVPVFGQPTDEPALRTLEQALPGYKIHGLRAEHIVVGLGSFHCLTQQQPA